MNKHDLFLMFFSCLPSAMCMEMAAPKALFPCRTNTSFLLSCWSWPYRGGLLGIHPYATCKTMFFFCSGPSENVSFWHFSQLLYVVLLLLRLWENGTREMDNERSTQGTSAPLLSFLQRFQNIHSSKEEVISEEDPEVKEHHSRIPNVLFKFPLLTV